MDKSTSGMLRVRRGDFTTLDGAVRGPCYLSIGHHENLTGGEFREGMWVVPPRVIYSTRWPEDARAEIALLRSALRRIAQGEGDPQEIAREALRPERDAGGGGIGKL